VVQQIAVSLLNWPLFWLSFQISFSFINFKSNLIKLETSGNKNSPLCPEIQRREMFVECEVLTSRE
jgi:hypothetical protein